VVSEPAQPLVGPGGEAPSPAAVEDDGASGSGSSPVTAPAASSEPTLVAAPSPAGSQAEAATAEQPAEARPLEGTDPFPKRQHGLLQSFNWAIEGLVWTLRHQRNMQIHFAIAVVVIVAALVFSVTRVELLMVFAAITFVFVAEMINTAVEYTVDLTISAKHPAAKIAKDVAAGAVFVAALNALAVAYLVFYDSIVDIPYSMVHRLRISEVDLTVVALVLTGLLVIVFKAAVGRGSALRGGWPSGHAAIAFGGWTAVTFIAIRTPYAIPISFVALIMAFLAAQSRVQAHIHTWLEVVAGGLLGVVVTAGVFFIWNPF
jgi:diacylglycerol kinase (ATP)